MTPSRTLGEGAMRLDRVQIEPAGVTAGSFLGIEHVIEKVTIVDF
jgi:hypothetical protein